MSPLGRPPDAKAFGELEDSPNATSTPLISKGSEHEHLVSQRVPYSEAAQAMRETVERALSHRLTLRQLQVLLAYIALVPSYSRIEDTVATKQVVDMTGIDERHVRRAAKRLGELGVIRRTPGNGRGHASVISFAERGATTSPPLRAKGGTPPAPLTPTRKGGRFERERGADSDHKGGPVVAHIREVIREDIREEQTHALSEASGAEGTMDVRVRGDFVVDRRERVVGVATTDQKISTSTNRYTPDFERFWNAYPRKQAKATAHKAWGKAILRAPLDDILDGVERYARDPNLPQAQYVPHPATWLNGDRWNDGPEPERHNGNVAGNHDRIRAVAQRLTNGTNGDNAKVIDIKEIRGA